MTSTLYIVGFPSDTTERELYNLCRFLPGYVGATPCVTKGPMLWVRFEDPNCAMAALPLMDGQPFNLMDPSRCLRASIAKTDTNPRPPESRIQTAPRAVVSTFVTSNAGWAEAAPPKRPRVEVGSQESDTAVLFSMGEKGYTKEDLLGFFQQIDGYITLMCTSPAGKGGGNCFIKFQSAQAALAAIEVAKHSSLELEIAKTSLNVPGSAPLQPSGGPKGAPGKGTSPAAPVATDTLIVFQIGMKGVSEEDLNYSVFGQMEGFLGLQISSGRSGGNAFVKFASPQLAQEAMKLAPEWLDVQMARTSLNLERTIVATPI